MRREGLLAGQLWNKDIREMVTDLSNSSGRAADAGKVKAKSKGHRSKFARKAIDDDWDLAATSSRPHGTFGAKVKVSSHALDYALNDAHDIYAACHAIDVACDAEIDDHTFDIDAACHAIDVACALKINDVDDNPDCPLSADVNFIDDAVAHDFKCTFDDYYENYVANRASTLHKVVGDGVIDAERDDCIDNVKRDEISDACHGLANHDPACTNMASCGPSVDQSNDKISDVYCVSSINNDNDSEISLVESDGNSLSSDWYHVASSDTEDWDLC